MSPKAHVPKRSRAKKAAAGFSDTPRLISQEEKHQLIRAHVSAHAPQDPLQRVSLWAGVSLSVMMIAVGWWMTVGWNVRHKVAEGSAAVRAATEKLNRFSDLVNSDPSLGLDALRGSTPSASASSFEEMMGRNLIAPANYATPTSTDTNTDTDDPVPSTPSGLTPDE